TAVGWLGVNGLLVILFNASAIPWPYIVLVFLPATLWVVWLGWMFYWPFSWRVRWGVLAACLAATVVARQLLKVEGLTGDAKAIFAWNWEKTPKEFGASELSGNGAAAAEPADLTRTSDRDYAQF